MKKILLPIIICLSLAVSSNATTHTVSVSNFQFSPNNMNVTVGDTIKWVWMSGSHTTTSASTPAAASGWDNPMTSGSTSFIYVVKIAGSYHYVCTPHAAFGMTADFTATSPLPIIIKSFDIVNAANKPLIKWTTLTEVNSAYFGIRRSFNGLNFKEIDKIAAFGNSSTEKTYSIVDESFDPSVKFIYYALASYDKDGQTQLSGIKIYKNGNSSAKLITQITNPVSQEGHCMLRFNADKEGKMDIVVTNLSGKVVLETKMDAYTGNNSGHLHLGDVPAGIYFVKFTFDGTTETKKLVKE